MNTVKILRLDKNAIIPFKAHKTDAGYDLFSEINITLSPLDRELIPTGIALEIPEGYEAQVRPRSGLAYKRGVTILNTPGTIDSGYRGEIGVIIINLSKDHFKITKGMKIAQLVFNKIESPDFEEVTALFNSDRGEDGFGSTGLK